MAWTRCDAVRRIEQLDVAGAGRPATHVDAGDDAVRAGQDHGAAGRPLGERVVADGEAGDGGQPLGRRGAAGRIDRRDARAG